MKVPLTSARLDVHPQAHEIGSASSAASHHLDVVADSVRVTQSNAADHDTDYGDMHLRNLAVSIVIPTYRRPQLLARCLLATLSQRAYDYEIIVADDGPDQATRACVESLRAGSHVPIHYLPVTRTQGPAGARNAGWRVARAPIVAFTDDDTIPDPGWLSSALRGFDENVDAVTGRVEMPLPPVITDYERDASGLATAEFVTANCLIRKSALERVGGFDERFTAAWREDSDIEFSILKSGGRVASVVDAVVVHPIRPAGFGASIRQQRKIQFDALLHSKHPGLYRQRIRAHAPYRYYLISTMAIAAAVLALAGAPIAVIALPLLAWALLTAKFCATRLKGTSKAPRHVLEMIVTSAAIPPLAVFWRIRGAFKFRTFFF
jgi:GT2 family glycosyltransferase